MAQGVDQQVAQHLGYAVGIGLSRRKIIGELDTEAHLLHFSGQAQVIHRVANDLGHVCGAQVQVQLPGVGQSEFSEVLHQAAQQPDLVVQARDFGLFERVGIIQNSPQVALQHTDRRA